VAKQRSHAHGPPPGFSTGLIPRDYTTHPPGCYASAPVAPADWLIPEAEWEDRLKEQQANQASLWDLREAHFDTLKSLDQDGLGLCWAFSSTKAVMYTRAVMNATPERLSAWYVAGRVKHWQDQGGWGAESLQQITSAGVPTEALCPSYKSQYDTAAVAADAATRKVIEWYDGTEDRDQNRRIMVSAFLLGLAPVLDYNWLSHSMCGCVLKSINPLEVWTDNSWNVIDQYGPKGCYKLSGSKAIPDGVVVPRVSQPGP
jgi:hypothetical protein